MTSLTDVDSRCQSFTARRGPVVHLADLVWLREALLAARRSPVVHRATMTDVTSLNFFEVARAALSSLNLVRGTTNEVARAGLIGLQPIKTRAE